MVEKPSNKVMQSSRRGLVATTAGGLAGCTSTSESNVASPNQSNEGSHPQSPQATESTHAETTPLEVGNIYALSYGGESKNLDPEEFDRPVQSAIDIINESTGGQGTVYLPPGTTIKEQTTIKAKSGINIIGVSSQSSEIQITKPGVPGLDLGEADFTRFDRFGLVGPGIQEDTGPAIYVAEDESFNDAHIGQLMIKDWANSAMDVHNCWASRIDHLRTSVDAGDENAILDFKDSGPCVQIGLIHPYPRNDSSNKNSDVLSIKDSGPITVNHLNIGGSAGRALVHRGSGRGRTTTINAINYEPSDHSGGTPREIIDLQTGTDVVKINSIKIVDYGIREDRPDREGFFATIADYVYTLRENEQDNFLSQPDDAIGALGENVVNIAGKLGSRPSYYYGIPDEVDNNADSDTQNLRVMHNAGTGMG